MRNGLDAITAPWLIEVISTRLAAILLAPVDLSESTFSGFGGNDRSARREPGGARESKWFVVVADGPCEPFNEG